MSATATRPIHSHLWDLSEEERRDALAEMDHNGKPIWTLERLTEDQAFMRPKPDGNKAQVAHLFLMAELREDPICDSCAGCGRPLTPQRAKQTCERCYKKGRFGKRSAL